MVALLLGGQKLLCLVWTVGRVSRVAIDLPPPHTKFFSATEIVPKLQFATRVTSGTERGFVNWKESMSIGRVRRGWHLKWIHDMRTGWWPNGITPEQSADFESQRTVSG